MRRYAVTLSPGDKTVEVEVREEPGEPGGPARLRVALDGAERVLELRASDPGRLTFVDGTRVINADVEPKAGKLAINVGGTAFSATVADARVVKIPEVGRADRGSGPVVVRAPMPGRVVKLLAAVGDEVKAGRGLLVVEAMKMENELRAPRDGRVREIRVAEGAAVEPGQELCILE